MSKEKITMAAIVVVGLLVSLGVSVYIIYAPSKEAIPTSASSREVLDVPVGGVLEVDVTYTDQAGFSFNHPSDIVVSDRTPVDGQYYTILDLQKGGEKLEVIMQDTQFEDIDAWKARDEIERELVGAVSLDGVSARQYVSESTMLTLAVDQGVLYTIEGPNTDSWIDVHELFISSFRFDSSEAVQMDNVPRESEGNVIYEEEEVIE